MEIEECIDASAIPSPEVRCRDGGCGLWCGGALFDVHIRKLICDVCHKKTLELPAKRTRTIEDESEGSVISGPASRGWLGRARPPRIVGEPAAQERARAVLGTHLESRGGRAVGPDVERDARPSPVWTATASNASDSVARA